MKKLTSVMSVGVVGFSFVSGFLAKDASITHCFAQPVIEAPAAPPPTKTAPVKSMEKTEKGTEKEPIKQRQEIGRYQLTSSPDMLYILDTTNGRCWMRETKPVNNINQNPAGWTEISPTWATAGVLPKKP